MTIGKTSICPFKYKAPDYFFKEPYGFNRCNLLHDKRCVGEDRCPIMRK